MKLFSKKVLIGITILSVFLAVGAIAYADSALKQVTAYQNQSLKVTVNGSPVDMSSEDGTMYPLVFEGHSYVSAKALAEKLGATVKWNNDTQTVEVTSSGSIPKGAGLPTKDNSSNKPNPAQTPDSKSLTITNKLPTGFNADEANKQMKPLAIALLVAHAKALKTGDLTEYNNLLKSSILVDNKYSDGLTEALEKEKAYVEGTRKANDLDIINKWADSVIELTPSQIKQIPDEYGSEYYVHFKYNLEIPGFSYGGILQLTLSFATGTGYEGFHLYDIMLR